MKILFITPQFPYPPQKGTTTRNFNIIKNLSRNHELHLVSFGDGNGAEYTKPLAEFCESIKVCNPPARAMADRVRDLFVNPKPDLAVRLASPELVEALRETLSRNRFDILQIEGLEMAWHWEQVWEDEKARSAVKAVVFDEHNAEYVLQQRAFEIDRTKPPKWIGAFYSLVQWQKLKHYEASICRSVSAVVAVSEVDRNALREITPLPRVAVVPNGVDTDYFRPVGPIVSTGTPGLLFTGTLDFRPNIDAVTWFCNEILPRVHREIPDVRFYVVGRDPAPAIVELGKDSRVIVTGFVDDVRPYFQQAWVYVVPMRFGGGIRFKVLEAMAAGVPVVSTSMGVEGIEAGYERDLIVADDPESFARSVISLLREEDLRKSLIENARTIIERKYDWRIIVPKLEELYATIA